MLLNTFDRLVLMNILPAHDEYTTYKLIRQLKADLSFSEEEHAALNFYQEGTRMQWSTDGDNPKEITIGPRMMVIITDILKQLNTDKKIGEEHMSLYEKFVIGEGNGDGNTPA